MALDDGPVALGLRLRTKIRIIKVLKQKYDFEKQLRDNAFAKI